MSGAPGLRPRAHADPPALEGGAASGGGARSTGPTRGAGGLLELVARFARFGVVGGSGVFVDMGVLYLLHDPRRLALPLITAKVIAAQLAIVNNFVWNELWTFRDRAALRPGGAARLRRFARFEGICLAGVAITVGVLWLCVRRFGLHYLLGNAVAIGVGTAWNFFLNLRWNWTAARRGPAA